MRFDRLVSAAGAIVLSVALISCDDPSQPRVAGDQTTTSQKSEPNQTAAETPHAQLPDEPAEPAPEHAARDDVEAYIVKGRVTTQRGEPLSGIEVAADNTFSYGSYLYGVSDADGYYLIDLSGAPNTTWRMWGVVEVTYDGRLYRQDLHVDRLSFASSEGAIRDFEWRLEGLRYGEDDYYYGGRGYVHENWYDYPDDAERIEDMSWVQVTFEPTAPLIDGSQGQTVVRQVEYGEFQNVPVGHYRISASYTPPGGSSVELLIADDREDEPDYGESVELVFDTDNSISLSVKHPN